MRPAGRLRPTSLLLTTWAKSSDGQNTNYHDPRSQDVGFLFYGTFASFTAVIPGQHVYSTYPSGINNAGDIVGHYTPDDHPVGGYAFPRRESLRDFLRASRYFLGCSPRLHENRLACAPVGCVAGRTTENCAT
jgi:hypothetical protein